MATHEADDAPARRGEEAAEAHPAEQGERKERPSWGRRIRRWLLWLILLAILAAIVVWAIRTWIYSRHHESTDDAFVSGHLVPVLTRVTGYVAHVYVQDFEHVGEGAMLVRLQDVDLRHALEEAEAAALEARAGARGRAGSPGQAEAQLLVAERQEAALAAQVDAARAAAVRADRDLARAEVLAAEQIISLQDLDAAREAAASAHAALRAAEAQQRGAAAAVENARAGVRAAAARLEGAEAAVAQARIQLSYARITAPVSGTVAKRTVDPGQLVEAGQPLMAIVADTGVYITANFKETQVANIHPGQSVAFSVDAYGGCEGVGRVESLSGATGAQFALLPPENATGNFVKVVQRIPVRIEVVRGCGEERPLRLGMSVDVHVRTR